MKTFFAIVALTFAAPAFAQAADPFTDGKNGDKIHVASHFVCPAKIGAFERDTASESDVETGADACDYAALDGIYGTIKLIPLSGPYSPRNSMAQDFIEQEGTGGKRVAESVLMLGPKDNALPVYARTYRTARAEALEYRILFAGAQIGNWAVEVTVEYADPRDTPAEKQFLSTVYDSARKQIAVAH
jgi:hypothetical protein